jgi:hypothetical protein
MQAGHGKRAGIQGRAGRQEGIQGGQVGRQIRGGSQAGSAEQECRADQAGIQAC